MKVVRLSDRSLHEECVYDVSAWPRSGSSHEQRADAAMPKAAHVPWRWRAQRKSVYELGGGWELHYEGGKHVLEPYIGRLDPKP